MKQIAFILCAISIPFLSVCTQKDQNSIKPLKVFQFNIWQEGTKVDGGFDAIVNTIVQTDADLVSLVEVRNYNDVDFVEKLVKALADKGHKYFGELGNDTGIISKYPIQEHKRFMDHGSISKAVINFHGNLVAFYAGHLDYTHYACYLPRGYDGITWEKMTKPVTEVGKIEKMNLDSRRDELIQLFIEDAQKEISKGNMVIYCGDNNEPSHLDWTEKTKDQFDHQGVVFEWNTTKTLEEHGYLDAYRVKYSDPASHPGFTWPADNPGATLKELTWAPDADERDRIDFCMYYPDERISLSDIQIMGPSSSIVRNKRVEENVNDPFLIPKEGWTSDHKGLVGIFNVQVKAD